MISENDLKLCFGKVLRELRKNAGLTQEELAANAELDRSYISLIERGINQPTLFVIFRICNQLKIDASYLIALVEAEINESSVA